MVLTGLKRFNLDVKEAKSTQLDNVSDIRRGDSDGEFTFAYATPQDHQPVQIQVLATDVDSYPKRSSYLIFTSSEHVGDNLDRTLQELASDTESKLVSDIIRIISAKLTARFDTETPSLGESFGYSEDANEFSDDSGFDDGNGADSDEEYMMELDPLPPTTTTSTRSFRVHGSLKRLKRQLREVRSFGATVSLFSSNSIDAVGCFSLAVPVTMLGISEEALEAWDLRSSDYVIMLIRLPTGCPDTAEFLELTSDQDAVQFRVGKCAGPVPSLATVEAAFQRNKKDTGGQQDASDAETGTENDDVFLPLCTSASLNPLLNQEFPGLLKLRRLLNLSWDEAQATKRNMNKQAHLKSLGASDLQDALDNINSDPGPQTKTDSLDLLHGDSANAKEDDLNIPLVALQFFIQRLINCTKYCMVCHQKSQGGFESLKPFVCDNDLCLYQYLSLGFGQSIEHEIINGPYVVDLLISFFYSAVVDNGLRELPRGLNLKCASTGSTHSPNEHIEVEACFSQGIIRFDVSDYVSYKRIRPGDFVLLIAKGIDPMPSTSLMTGGLERHLCVVDSIQADTCTFRITLTRTSPPNVLDPAGASRPTQATHPSDGWIKMLLFQYQTDLDDLTPVECSMALAEMTNIIPSVLHMREYLTGAPGRRLASWKRMNKSTLTLLNWIVSSNRSFIVQNAPISNGPRTGLPNEDKPISSDQVKGMDESWMQFRFAQGSPEKEQKFMQELEKYKTDDKQFPTIFAWHGSNLNNWHSIIRTGLDFQEQRHGRTFGNGVYLSNRFDTSSVYMGHGIRSPALSALSAKTFWPNSVLKVNGAISLCEIINEPDQFVSSSPHYVVKDIEWIQCRYLFVKISPEPEAMAFPFPKPSRKDAAGYLSQDPTRPLLGPRDAYIEIPTSAVPVRRRDPESLSDPRSASAAGPDADADDNMMDYVDDPLASDDEEADIGKIVESPVKEKDGANLNVTPFTPDTLDLGAIPKLLEPGWAASSLAALRSLNHEIRDLQHIQSTNNLASLGWYVDFEQLSNLFHWIVEFHSFDLSLPLAQDMNRANCSSIVVELRFGSSYPLAPPFVRVISPRFLPFARGGGGHVTAGGAICSELLTNSGWSPALSLEKVLLEVRMNLCDLDPPARLESPSQSSRPSTYGIGEAVDAFRRAAASHGWSVPSDLAQLTSWN